jgi:hypothetical protein
MRVREDRMSNSTSSGRGRKPAKRGQGSLIQQPAIKILLGVLLLPSLTTAARPDELFKLSNSQKISCGRDLARGKLRTATCTSFTYLFNTRTSEYFRCEMSLVVTRDKKEVLIVRSDGHCVRKAPIFSAESNYDFDASETEPTNMNSFFGSGGHAIWAADTTRQKVRGCLAVASAFGSDVTRCLDMSFE